ncbi:MAG: Uncharacterised protein [Methanobacteriota archaeon]|nr:MAG: Uncharacterised protein [Euryarchaeota archaeon]
MSGNAIAPKRIANNANARARMSGRIRLPLSIERMVCSARIRTPTGCAKFTLPLLNWIH